MLLRPHPLDGALLYFDRSTGTNVRLDGPGLQGLTRSAPRVVHVGLTNRCNLRCAFCFRDRSLESAWTAEEILAWARTLAAAGALEIAFGQGEPLLFPGFPALVRALHAETPLAVNFTTNGLRLGPALLSELDGAYGQIRLSWYDDNAPLARAGMLARLGARFGVNLLVTPAALPSLRSTVEALVDAGCRDVLLLSYNGPDPSLHLTREDDRALARALLELHARHGAALALKLSVCFGRRLPEVPQHLIGEDCGAGDDFITLDSAKRLLPCSFHAEATPVGSADEALAVYRSARARRAPAGVRGCAREGAWLARARRAAGSPGVLVWQGWASNHSTSYTLVGEFPSAAKAEACAEAMRRLLERCAAYLERPRSATVWSLLGREGPAPDHRWEADPSDLAMWQPDAVIAGGRRLVVHSDSTLGDLRVLGLMLLEGRGRILWQRGDKWRHFRLVFGVEGGSVGGAHALARRIWPALEEAEVSGVRLYGTVASHDLARAAPLLGDLPHSIAVAGESEERLVEALASPAALPPRKRRVEWLHLPRESLDAWNAILADLSRDPAASMAELGWTAPFRMPARLEATRLLHGILVRTEGAPVPGALQRYLIGRGVRWMQVLDQAELRMHLHLPVGDEDNDGRVHILSERALGGLSRPGWAREVRSCNTRLEILPRDPFAACAQITAICGDQRRAELDLSPSRPLADAVARIQADLDASGPPTGGPAGV